MKLEIATLLIRLGVAVFASLVVPAIRRWLAEKTENEKLNRVKEWAYTAVSAAEQVYRKSKIKDPNGTLRRNYAVKIIGEMCHRAKIKLTQDELHAIVEAAVSELNLATGGGSYTEKTVS